MILKIYQILTSVAGPLIDLYMLKRKKDGKEDPARFGERMGYSSIPRPKGSVVWIHAASVGEALSILPLIKKLSSSYIDVSYLLTTGTTSSAKLVESRLPDNVFHQYVPIDKISVVHRFLRQWRPNLALWVESELWPNLLVQTSKICPILLLNGRMSDVSYGKWSKYKSIISELLGCFSLCLAQSQEDAKRFENLGAHKVKYVGNIKFDAPPLPSDSQKMGELVNMIGERPVWLATSTHAGEEVAVAEIHKNLKEEKPELLTIIAPRHPARAAEIIKQIKGLGLNVAQRSKDELVVEDTDIYLADTLGELGVLYRLSPLVFIGGSLVERGGQNPLEAARLGCVIIYGPHMYNFVEITGEIAAKQAAVKINSQQELEDTIESLILDYGKQEDLAKSAQILVDEKSGIVDAFSEEIALYMKEIATKKNEETA